MGAIVVERERIDDAAAREGQPGLALEPRNLVGKAMRERMRAAVGQRGVEHTGGIVRRDRTIGDPPCRRRDLDHRLEPVEPARAGAHDLDVEMARGRRLPQRGRDLVRADREGAGVAGNEDAGRHRCACASSASRRRSSSRPTSRPSSIADGAIAHRPRQ